MNVLLLLTIVFAIFIAADILSAKLLGVKRTHVRNISLVLLCALAVTCAVTGWTSLARSADMDERTLYNAYSYLLEGNIEKAGENASKVRSPHSDMILLIVDCMRGNYASAFIYADDLKNSGKLDDDLYKQADAIYKLSRQMTGLDGPAPDAEQAGSQLMGIAKKCFTLLEISEKKEVEFLSGFKRDRLLNSSNFSEVDPIVLRSMLMESPRDTELLRFSVKYCNSAGKLDLAEENARKLLKAERSVENIALFADVIAQKLLSDVSIETYDENDKEIAELTEKAKEAEVAAALYSEGNPRREENLGRAAEYRRQANAVKAKRIINWLTAQAPLAGDRSGVIDLQISRLYAAAGEDDKARGILLDLIARSDSISGDSPVKSELEQLSRAYTDISMADDDINKIIEDVLESDAFLSDSVLGRSYSQFLNKLLRYERVTILISSIDAENYPVVRAYLNVSGKRGETEELANDFELTDFTFTDNGHEIAYENIKRVEEDKSTYVNIALVVDGSGSMAGPPMENARRAVEACIENMRTDVHKLSIVMYDNYASVLAPMTGSRSELEAGAAQLYADGGTNIPSGLFAGLETLEGVIGSRAIILMSDGQDGNREQMEEAINAAIKAGVAVYTVGFGECDREYMQDIAKRTGGRFMEALSEGELANVYTSLQSFIVNNYCFEYEVREDREANPRLLTIGIKEYGASSSRRYSHGGLVLTEDGSYVVRGDSNALRLLYAEPSVVSARDAELGVPVFINAAGVTDGAKLYVNGAEMKDAKAVKDSGIVFMLKGRYRPGALNITVQLPDGTARSSDQLVAIAGSEDMKAAGRTIMLGRSGNSIYADNVTQTNDRTLILEGNVVLNGFLRTDSRVTLQAYGPITENGGRLQADSGDLYGRGAVYTDFTPAAGPGANYGQLAFGGRSLKVLDILSLEFDANSIRLTSTGTTLSLPGFGEVYGDAQWSGNGLLIKATYGNRLYELQSNLNYALNGIPLAYGDPGPAKQWITGRPQQQRFIIGNGLSVTYDSLTITIEKDHMDITGTAQLSGNIGPFSITGGNIAIDTSDTDSMFSMEGIAQANSRAAGLSGQFPVKIGSSGWYPDTFRLNAPGLSIDAADLGECFEGTRKPGVLDAKMTVNYPVNISGEPYKGQVSGILDDVVLDCDRVEFSCTDDLTQNIMKVYNSADPDRYVEFFKEQAILPISDVDELMLFGTELGGEIIGTATVTDREIILSIDVDGHLDNEHFSIRHDGRANISLVLYRNANSRSTINVTLAFDGRTLTYTATTTGNIIPQDGFNVYAEEY